MLTNTPPPPYYAVIFSSILSHQTDGYQEMSTHITALARQQDGFLGEDSARSAIGITVSYWRDLESIANWRSNAEHKQAKLLGKSSWYQDYTVRIAKVEKAY